MALKADKTARASGPQRHSLKTPRGVIDREKLNALVEVRAAVLKGFRRVFSEKNRLECTPASLVNIAGSCENPDASFEVNYYGRPAHLSQSAQLQLETLVVTLCRPVFTVHSSFREENFEDPLDKRRRLSEFTLVEVELPLPTDDKPDQHLGIIMSDCQLVLKEVISGVVGDCGPELMVLGASTDRLEGWLAADWNALEYQAALEASADPRGHKQPTELNREEEVRLLELNGGHPLMVTDFPEVQKFFNMKRLPRRPEYVASFDILMAPLGEVAGGGIREENSAIALAQLKTSRIGQFLSSQGVNVTEPFRHYFEILETAPPCRRGGYGIGFERLVASLIGSTDILETLGIAPFEP